MPQDQQTEQRLDRLEKLVSKGSLGQRFWRLIISLLVVALLSTNVLLWKTIGERESLATKQHHFWILCQEGTSKQERRKAFLALVESGHSEWASARLEGLDLSDLDLRNSNLQRSHFEGARLERSNLSGCNLTGAQLDTARLAESVFDDAILYEADLLKVDLTDARLQRSNCSGAYLGQADLVRTQFTSADLRGANLTMSNMVQADLRLANLREAILAVTNLTNADLFLCDLAGANLTKAILTNANWWRARGLTSEQIARFEEEFAPNADAGEERLLDYQRWLEKKSGSDSEATKP